MLGGQGVTWRLAKSGVNLVQGETPAISQRSSGGWSPHATPSLASELASSEDPALNWSKRSALHLAFLEATPPLEVRRLQAGSMHLEAPCSLPSESPLVCGRDRGGGGGAGPLAGHPAASWLGPSRRPGLNLASPHCNVRLSSQARERPFLVTLKPAVSRTHFFGPLEPPPSR